MYSINIALLISRLLPWFKRQPVFNAWLQALLYPVKQLNEVFAAYTDSTYYALSITGQLLYLEKLLNDKFNGGLPARAASSTIGMYDGTPTGIYISDPAGTILPQYVWNKAEERPAMVLYNKAEAEDKTYLRNIAEIDGEYDFIVNVPFSVGNVTTNAQLMASIKAWVNVYRIAGKRFNVVNY
jgi:hypothetical protein